MTNTAPTLDAALLRIAEALERLSPQASPAPDFAAADAFIWQAEENRFVPVPRVNRMPIALLKSVDRMRDTLLANTQNFARGLPANNALLWGSRGMGKSSLVKAVHAEVAARQSAAELAHLKLVEIHREDIASLPRCLSHLRGRLERFILFCDDLSFDADDTSYKSLKAVLEGGIEGRPANVVFYATSNRRHLMPREMMDNERATAINPGEAVEEKVFALRPFRPLDRLPQLQPRRLSRHGAGLRGPLRALRAAGAAARRSTRMGHDARLALRPRGVAVHPGFGRPARAAAGVIPTARSHAWRGILVLYAPSHCI